VNAFDGGEFTYRLCHIATIGGWGPCNLMWRNDMPPAISQSADFRVVRIEVHREFKTRLWNSAGQIQVWFESELLRKIRIGSLDLNTSAPIPLPDRREDRRLRTRLRLQEFGISQREECLPSQR